MNSALSPTVFKTPAAFRVWLEKHHATATEVFLLLYRVHAADRGLTYKEALDEALCFGWIDGVLQPLDKDTMIRRFTPRKARSIWSNVNVAHVDRLVKAGKMTKAGLAAFEARDAKRTGIYSFELPKAVLEPALEKRFRANKAAWKWFHRQAPWYQKRELFRVASAKQEATRVRRLEALMARAVEE